MSWDLVIRNGLVVGPESVISADIAIEGDKIASVMRAGTYPTGTQVLDAHGTYVFPGGVDPHVHSALALGEFTTLDDFRQSTMAAALGGTTTIVDFAIPQAASAMSPLECAEARVAQARSEAVVDVAFHSNVVNTNAGSMKQLEILFTKGLTTLKVFTIYPEVMLSLEELHECMKVMARQDGLVLVHAESPHIVEPLRAEFVSAGMTDAYHHCLSRPPESERDMVRSVIELLRITRCKGYFVHISTPQAAIDIARARLSGVMVWAETCPHYVLLDDSAYMGRDGELFICSPPLRSRETAQKLWNVLLAGGIQLWGSDHCCYDSNQKLKYRNNFTRVPGGLPGVEVRAPLLYSHGVASGVLSPERFVSLTATNPAKLNGLYPRKGILAPGSDADIVIYGLGARTLSASELHMPTDFSPYEGLTLEAWPSTVIARGQVMVDRGQFTGSAHRGEVLQAGRPQPVGVDWPDSRRNQTPGAP